MKHLIQYAHTPDGEASTLVVALLVTVVASTFSLLHAFAGPGSPIGLVAPIFIPG